MNPTKALFLLSLFLVLSSFTKAQETPLPLFDPNEIFVEGIQWIPFIDRTSENVQKPGFEFYSHAYNTFITGFLTTAHKPCTLTQFLASETLVTELAYECHPIVLNKETISLYYQYQDHVFFLTKESEDSNFVKLESFDLVLGIRNPLIFGGEIENILHISPNGDYLVFIADNNNLLENLWMWQPCCSVESGFQVIILRLSDQEIVYVSEPIGVYVGNQAIWIDETTLVVAAQQEYRLMRFNDTEDFTSYKIPQSLRRIDLATGTIHITTRDGLETNQFEMKASGHFWLQGSNLIDLRDFSLESLFRDDAFERYDLISEWLPNGNLKVTIYSKNTNVKTIIEVVLQNH